MFCVLVFVRTHNVCSSKYSIWQRQEKKKKKKKTANECILKLKLKTII